MLRSYIQGDSVLTTKKRALCLGIAIVSIAMSSPILAMRPLTAEELTPFCSNEMIWGKGGIAGDKAISKEKCLSVAVSCSKKIASDNPDLGQATQDLYSCVFDGLGISLKHN